MQNGYIVDSTKPYKKGETINYLGLNYTFQTDVASGKKVLLILDGLIAIGEEVSNNSFLNERVVLNRKVNPEVSRQDNLIPYLWSISFTNDQSYYRTYYTDRRNTTEETSIASNPNSSTINWFVWSNTRNEVYTLGFSLENNILAFANKNGRESIPTELNGFTNILTDLDNLSYSNSWLWNPSSKEIVYRDVESLALGDLNLGGFTTLINTGEATSPFILNSVNALSESCENEIPTKTIWSGVLNVFPGRSSSLEHSVNHFWLYAAEEMEGRHEEEIPETFLHILDRREFNTSYLRPKLVDTELNRAIVYKADNYSANCVIHDINKDGDNVCTKYSIDKGNLGIYYIDYEQEIETPVNSFGPYSIPITDASLAGKKASYNVGDILTITYPSQTVGQGFPSDEGHYTSLESNPLLSTACAEEETPEIFDPCGEFGTLILPTDGSPPYCDCPEGEFCPTPPPYCAEDEFYQGENIFGTLRYRVSYPDGSSSGFTRVCGTAIGNSSFSIYGPSSDWQVRVDPTPDPNQPFIVIISAICRNDYNPSGANLAPIARYDLIFDSSGIIAGSTVSVTQFSGFRSEPFEDPQVVPKDVNFPDCIPNPPPDCGDKGEPQIETYVHDMTVPIDHEVAGEITSVSTSGTWSFATGREIACPIPTIEGNRIVSNFDSLYSDNSGSCTYEITYRNPEGCPREHVPPCPADPGINDPENPLLNLPENQAREGEIEAWLAATQLPFNAWGYIPTTGGGVIGVKVKVTSLTTTSTNRATVVNHYKYNTDYHQYIPLVKLKFIRRVVFEIVEIGTEEIQIPDSIYYSLFSNSDCEFYNDPDITPPKGIRGYTDPSLLPTKGYLFYGNSFGNCGSSALDHPESALLNMPLNPNRLYNEKVPYCAGVRGHLRYQWENLKGRDYLWSYPSSIEGQVVYCPRFEFVLTDNKYDLVFQGWDKLEIKEEGLDLKDISFHAEDKNLRRPRVRDR